MKKRRGRSNSLLYLVVILLTLLFFLFLGTGCSAGKKEAYYGFFGSESVVLVVQDRHMVIVQIGSPLVEWYAAASGLNARDAVVDLVGVPSLGFFGTDTASLAELRSLLTTLTSETLSLERSRVTPSLVLSTVQSRAGDLRKTPFVSTLELLTGFPDGLALLEKMKACHIYDVGQFILIDQDTDWKEVKHYLSRWLSGALLLE